MSVRIATAISCDGCSATFLVDLPSRPKAREHAAAHGWSSVPRQTVSDELGPARVVIIDLCRTCTAIEANATLALESNPEPEDSQCPNPMTPSPPP